MVDEQKTKIVLEGEARGFDRVQKMVDELVGATTGGAGKEGALGALDKILTSLASNLGKVEDAVSRLDKSVRGFSGGQGGKPGSTAPSAPSAGSPGAGQARQPSFSLGLAQGLGIAQYMPGMTRGALIQQSLGVGAGRAIRGVGGGLASSPFTGMSGFQQALGSVPVFGGLAAGVYGTAAQAAERANDLDRARLEGAFGFDFAGGRQAATRAGGRFTPELGRIRAHNAEQAAIGGVLDREQTGQSILPAIERAVGAVLQEAGARHPGVGGALGLAGGLLGLKGRQQMSPADEQAMVDRVMSRAMAAGGQANVEAQAAFGQERQGAMRAARRQVLFGGGIRGLGMRFGMDESEAQRFTNELLRSGGGTRPQAMQGDAIEAAMAAQARFGVGVGTSGAFLRGARTGGLTGGGEMADRLADALAHAVEAGLEGAEVAEHLERMAAGIEAFAESGIPVSEESLAALGRTFTLSGMSPQIGAIRGMQLQRGVQQQAMQGLPTTGGGFAALRALGGFRGGGMEGALTALERLQTGNFAEGGEQELARMTLKSAGGNQRLAGLLLQRGLGQFGAPVGLEDARAIIAQATGQEVEPGRQAAVARSAEAVARGKRQTPGRGREALFAGGREAMGTLAPALQREAAIRNTLEAAGRQVRSTVQDLNEASAIAARAIGNFAPKIKMFTDNILEASSVVEKFAKSMAENFNITMQSGG